LFEEREKIMSDNPVIQISATDQLQGGQHSLQPDVLKSTHGFDASNQNSLSFCRGTNIEASSSISNAKDAATPNNTPSDLNAGLSVTGRANEQARHVDEKVLEGSGGAGSDFRKSGDTAKSSLWQAAVGAGGPRNRVGQFPQGKSDATNGSFGKDYHSQEFPAVEDGD
jgi:hypothetical protein